MTTLAHADAIAEARSCLADLADTAHTVDGSIVYDRALLYLDGLVGDFVPGISPLNETDRNRLLARLESAVEELVTYGLDGLSAELLLYMLNGPAESAGL